MTIESLNNEGFTPKEIAEKLELTPQKVGVELKKLKEGDKPKKKDKPEKLFQTFTSVEYEMYSLKNGRTRYGGEKGVKVKATIEELRAFINSGWKPSMLIEKWQFTEKELTQLVWKLSKAELRDKPIACNFKQDFFRS